MSVLNLIPVWFVLALLIPTVWAVTGAYRRARGGRAVICPATGESAMVSLDARDAALMHVLGNPVRKVELCTCWPERRNCGRECLQGISN